MPSAGVVTIPSTGKFRLRGGRIHTSLAAGWVRSLSEDLLVQPCESDSSPVIVEMRPGGNMTIAGRSCAEAPNDGCVLPSETLSYARLLHSRLSFEPEKLEPIKKIEYRLAIVTGA